MVAASTIRASRRRLMAPLPRKFASAGFWRGCTLGRRKPGVGHARRKLRHHGKPFRALHPVPARDLRQRTSAAETETGSGVDHADGDTRRFLAHSGIVKGFGAIA